MSDNYNGGYRGDPGPPPAPSKEKQHNIPVWAWVAGGLVLAAFAVLITLLFTGGDDKKDESAPQPAPTVTVTEKAPEPEVDPMPKETTQAAPVPDITTEEGFIDFLREEYPILETVPDNEIIDRANRACDLFDGGATMDEVVDDAVKKAKSADEAGGYGAIVGGSVAAVCPEHYDQLAPHM